jgi:signal transduction histidine kinase
MRTLMLLETTPHHMTRLSPESDHTVTFEAVVWPAGTPAHFDETLITSNRELSFLLNAHLGVVGELMHQLRNTGLVSACSLLFPGDSLYVIETDAQSESRLLRLGCDAERWQGTAGQWDEDTLVVPFHIAESRRGFFLGRMADSERPPAAIHLCEAYARLLEKEILLIQSRQRLNYYATSLQKKNREIFEKNQFGSNMLSITTHDLSSPLNAVDGYLNLLGKQLTDGFDADHITRYYQHISAGIQDIFELLKQLQNISSIQTGQFTLQLAVFDANWIVRDTVDFLKPLTDKKGKRMTLTCADEPLHIRADLSMIRRVLTNIIMNAVKYTGVDGHIDVSVERVEQSVRIHIRDDGVGIPADKKASIFEPFIRLHTGGTDADAHSKGLGLFIASYLCKTMEGSVSVESELGSGSTFTVCFPIRT